MRIQHILSHGLVLAAVNLGAILAGFAVYCLDRSFNQIAVQVPFAVMFSGAGYGLVIWMLCRRGRGNWLPQGRTEFLWVFLFSLLWQPAILYPLHYLTQGYLSAFSNIVAVWIFQAPVNGMIVLTASFSFNPLPRKPYEEEG